MSILQNLFTTTILLLAPFPVLSQQNNNDEQNKLDSFLKEISQEEKIKKYEHQKEDFTDYLNLQILNKITTKTYNLKITKSKIEKFSNIEITLYKCWLAPSIMKPESKALLQISEITPNDERKELFFGWMFSSSPAIAAIVHPVYDVVITSCIKK